MTEMSGAPASAAAPGWYGDPWRVAPLRWWDGVQWTAHVSGGAPAYVQPSRRVLPAGTPTSTAWLWVTVLLPLVPLMLLAFYRPHIALRPGGPDGALVVADPFSLLGGWMYIVLQAVSLASTALLIVAAWRDHRALTSLGVERPFHWAWAFLGSIVYVIGRTVIVRKVVPGSSVLPLVLTIVVNALGFVGAIAWTIATMSTLFSTALDPTVVGA